MKTREEIIERIKKIRKHKEEFIHGSHAKVKLNYAVGELLWVLDE